MIGTDPVLTLDLWLTEEPACQSRHGNVPECTVHVAYRVDYCMGYFLLCTAAVERPFGTRHQMEVGRRCRGCGQSAGDCWRETPV